MFGGVQIGQFDFAGRVFKAITPNQHTCLASLRQSPASPLTCAPSAVNPFKNFNKESACCNVGAGMSSAHLAMKSAARLRQWTMTAACYICRDLCKTSTRHGASLITSFPAAKHLLVSATSKRKRDEPPPREGPSAGFAGVAGAHNRAGRLKRKGKKSKDREVCEAKEDGGHAFQDRGEARHQGIPIPAVDGHTCRACQTAATLSSRFCFHTSS